MDKMRIFKYNNIKKQTYVLLRSDIIIILNQEISVIAIFDTEGNIKPYKFKYKDKSVIVHKVVKSYLEKLAGNYRIVFVCLHNEKDNYKLKYEIDSHKWYLFKDNI